MSKLRLNFFSSFNLLVAAKYIVYLWFCHVQTSLQFKIIDFILDMDIF